MTIRAKLSVAVLLLVGAGVASAQVYKWKDAEGVTHFSDAPPAASATGKAKIEVKSYETGAPAADLPPELADAVKNNPVTLYTTSPCSACDQARTMLKGRGIPFAEKTVSSKEDHAAMQKAGSERQFPFLLVGSKKNVGYDQAGWDAALTAAGYPVKGMLPANYQYPAPSPAAGPKAPAPSKPKEEPKAKPPADGSAPPGFQF